VGFGPLTEATNKTNAGSMARTSNQRSQLGATHSNVLGAACHAHTRNTRAAIDSSEKTPRNGPSSDTLHHRIAQPCSGEAEMNSDPYPGGDDQKRHGVIIHQTVA
jgi:hypothetical protein